MKTISDSPRSCFGHAGLLIGALLGAFGLALDDSSAAGKACLQSTISQEECLSREVAQAREKMNSAWADVKRLAAAVDPISLHFLRLAQRNWQTFFDLDCLSESYDAFGGSLMESIELQCQAHHLNERTKFLKSIGNRLRIKETCPFDLDSEADRTSYDDAVNAFTSALERVGNHLDAEKLFNINVRKTLLRTFTEAQQAWRQAQKPDCFASYLLFCRTDALTPDQRDAWLRRCEAATIQTRTQDLRIRTRSLDDALTSNESRR